MYSDVPSKGSYIYSKGILLKPPVNRGKDGCFEAMAFTVSLLNDKGPVPFVRCKKIVQAGEQARTTRLEISWNGDGPA